MLRQLYNRFRAFASRPLEVLKTRQNVIIIQMYPKDRAIAVSYKGQVRTAQFQNNDMKNMLRSHLDFEEYSFEVFQTAANLLMQIINRQ